MPQLSLNTAPEFPLGARARGGGEPEGACAQGRRTRRLLKSEALGARLPLPAHSGDRKGSPLRGVWRHVRQWKAGLCVLLSTVEGMRMSLSGILRNRVVYLEVLGSCPRLPQDRLHLRRCHSRTRRDGRFLCSWLSEALLRQGASQLGFCLRQPVVLFCRTSSM